MKKLSVIVPVYNVEKWIEETLDSLLVQTYRDIEIICVDDGSTDKSCEIIRKKMDSFSNIKLIKKPNQGVSTARNRGIEEAKGDYIAFLDSDDFLEAEAYEKMIDLLEKENSDIVFCEFVRFWPNGKLLYTTEHNFSKLLKNPQDIKYFMYSTNGIIDNNTLYTNDIHGSVCRSVFKMKIIDDFNIKFEEDLKFAEDQIFILKYIQKVKKISYTPKPYVWYRAATKSWRYHNLFSNNLKLLNCQKKIIFENNYYSNKEKNQIIGYLKCSTYFMIINEELMFKKNFSKIMEEYSKNKEFSNLLTIYNFYQKYKIKKETKRIVFFILLKTHMWKVIQVFYPNKKY